MTTTKMHNNEGVSAGMVLAGGLHSRALGPTMDEVFPQEPHNGPGPSEQWDGRQWQRIPCPCARCVAAGVKP